MLCADCNGRRWEVEHRARDEGGVDSYLCRGCGALLIAPGRGDRLLDYLGRLSSLGLATPGSLLAVSGRRDDGAD